MNTTCACMNYGYDYDGVYIKKIIPKINENKNNYKVLNPHGGYSQDFTRIDDSKEYDGKTVYKSMDARLYDAARNNRLVLDRPPPDGNIDMEKIHNNKELNNYKCGVYSGYENINAGQIVYYTTDSTPFGRPVFMEKATSYGIRYKNPMDTTSMVYTREPIEYHNHMNTIKKEYNGGLSWIRDSSTFREDLISRQKIKMNSRKWFPE